MMTKKISADDRFFSDYGWLQTFWLFSFSDYYDPDNMNFGNLRVYNDDVIAPHQGFGTHPHNNMEIITIVLKGEITHKDSMGNETVIKANEVQCMSAGTGVSHSEFNQSDEELHLHQIWFTPDERNLKPSYAQKEFSPKDWHNTLLPLASGQGLEGAVNFGADANLFRCRLDAGKSVSYDMSDDRKIFIYVIQGAVAVNDEHLLSKNDQLRLTHESALMISASKEAEFILIDAH